MPWIYDKPVVYKDEHWVAELDHGTWYDRTYFDSWDAAMEHALWIGLNAGVWKLSASEPEDDFGQVWGR